MLHVRESWRHSVRFKRRIICIPTSYFVAFFDLILLYTAIYLYKASHDGRAMLTSNLPIPQAVAKTAMIPTNIVSGFR